MLFSFVCGLMVILIAVFWAYQGLLGAALMFFEAVIASMIAFGYYESLNSMWDASLGTGVGLPLAFMVLFLVPLFIMRMLTDKMIPQNLTIPMYVDRAGGGLFGFFTGMILIGSALIGMQMLPLGSGIIGFERWTAKADGTPQRNNILLKPDEFTVGMANMLSNGRFGGDNPFAQAKPDLLEDLYSVRADVQSESMNYLPKDALSVTGYWTARQIDQATHAESGGALTRKFETRDPVKSTNQFLVCRVRVSPKAAPKEKAEIRFRLPQFRVVGPAPDKDGKFARTPEVYLATGMSDIYTHKKLGMTAVGSGQASRLVMFSPQTDFILGPNETKEVEARGGQGFDLDVAFEVPDGFEPWFLEFKRGPRVELTPKMAMKEPPSDAASARGSDNVAKTAKSGDDEKPKKPAAPKVGAAPAGRTQVANAVEERTGVSDELPIPLDRNEAIVSRALQAGKLNECKFWVEVPTKEIDAASRVTKFFVPSDKKMVQIGAEKMEALSMYGRALSFANRVAAQISITDSKGQKYYAIGQYGAAEVEGKLMFEVQYYPADEVPERALSGKKPQKVTESILNKAGRTNSKFGYIFLVDPGVKIVSFEAGKGGGQTLNIDVPE